MTGLRRYNLSLPTELYDTLQQTAKERDTTVLDLIRRFIKLGLIILEAENRPDTAFILREGDREREVVLL